MGELSKLWRINRRHKKHFLVYFYFHYFYSLGFSKNVTHLPLIHIIKKILIKLHIEIYNITQLFRFLHEFCP